MKIIVGLGNPGEEYTNTRHNTGRIVLEAIRVANKFPEWEKSDKYKAIISEGKIGKEKLMLVEPETFMNKSGVCVGLLIKNAKQAENLVVIHDDLDIATGHAKMSFSKSSGGHRGVESIIKVIKTESFTRIRVGISPATPSGKLKKPSGEKAVEKTILGKFTKPELLTIKKISKRAVEAIAIFVTENREKAVGVFNSSK